MAEFRILSLDGGGCWALIQVKTLIDLYSRTGDGSDITGHELLRKFDLIVANSAGSMTLGGLIENVSLKTVLSYFTDAKQRRKIFVEIPFWKNWLLTLARLVGFGPQYVTEQKLRGLKAVLGREGTRDVTSIPEFVGRGERGRFPHVVFCAFDYDLKRGVFFRSDVESRAASFGPHVNIKIAEAVHCSTNAPVRYFAAPARGPEGRLYWDGAVGGYNNPVLAGVVEAVANLEHYKTDRASIKVLSLGTANVVLPRSRPGIHDDSALLVQKEKWGVKNDLKKLAKSILDEPPDTATFHSHLMLGCEPPAPQMALPVKSRIVRFNPLIQGIHSDPQAPWQFPCMSRGDFIKIRDLDMVVTAQADIDRIIKLCDLWLEDHVPNQPIRANSATLEPEIGYNRYSAAKDAWKELFAD